MSIIEVVLGSLDEYPLLLTVEEAAELMRIGRSLADELARQYEVSDGHDGLPTMRVSALMRVPRWASAELVSTGRVRGWPTRWNWTADMTPCVVVWAAVDQMARCEFDVLAPSEHLRSSTKSVTRNHACSIRTSGYCAQHADQLGLPPSS